MTGPDYKAAAADYEANPITADEIISIEVYPVAPKDRLIADITAELDAEDADEEE
ncbi:Uncharacterised protein [Mycobacteroides abscessus]|uniref:hypothetical protein n=1 Tax=Mycobacteroides abscessus TaxID=36809 RepID=UPI0005DD81B7|nr:hypothetical protein [Mycobacteroides abscessus]CPT94389.1 Uncharacterised protein [Mycobacteroides abscessus]CPW13466.1 Uncharacterised protein [Mycobacteroides abscessus]CQA09671.1 Uncharacterised protein [Mycobacteroides abscessus]